MPGQAVSCKIGQLKTAAIRQKVVKKLGKQFAIRAFHDEVLKDGAMPLQIFEAKLAALINNQLATGKKS